MTPPPEDSRVGTPRPELRAVPRIEPARTEPDAKPARPRRAKAKAAGASNRTRKPVRKAKLVEAPAVVVRAVPVPQPATPKPRHWAMLASFVLIVLAPLALTVWYLYSRAADQYHSEVAFSIRSEEGGSAGAMGILGALTQIGSGSASDADILFEYIRSQKIVEEIDPEIDLRAIFRKAAHDPVFTLGHNPSIEALVDEWHRKVEVGYDSKGGIIHVRAYAFTPQDAQKITQAVLVHAGAMVNRLSDQAREDAVRFARQALTETESHLRTVRQQLADFRRDNRIVDPKADAAGQMGLLNALQGQLAQALVDRDVMLSYADAGDQRVIQVNRRIDAITERIEAERASLGIPGAAGSASALPDVLSTYEELQVDLEFANKAYVQTLAGLAAASAEARRQSRYLAPHIQPTLASSSLYPRRALLSGLTGLFLLLGWGIIMIIYYNVRDNR
jgi:capsular polysaccharide transport system permease protein